MNCPSCKTPMIRSYVKLSTGETLWKCRKCSYTEKTDAEKTENSKSSSSGKA